MELENLVIKEGKLVWAVYVDLMCLNFDGNILDCGIKAMVAALENVTLPEVTIEGNNSISISIQKKRKK